MMAHDRERLGPDRFTVHIDPAFVARRKGIATIPGAEIVVGVNNRAREALPFLATEFTAVTTRRKQIAERQRQGEVGVGGVVKDKSGFVRIFRIAGTVEVS